MPCRCLIGMLVLSFASVLSAQPNRAASGDAVLVVVNGQAIRQSQLDRVLKSRRVPEKLHSQMRPLFLNELVDAAVMRKFLADRDAMPSPTEIEAALDKLKQVASKGKPDSDAVLQAAGFDDAALREEVTLPLAWQKHVLRVVTQKSLRDYFQAHREEFDGTRIRARHIFIKVATEQPSAELEQAEEQLRQVRQQILAGELTFEEAAHMYSQGPSASKGGDLGDFPWHGKMPEAFCRVAFALKSGEVSQPFKTPFGVHVCTVIEKKPGQAALEDSRELVLAQLSQELWKKTAAEQRAKAKIESRSAQP